MEKPHECHLIIVKRVLRYIKGKIDHGVLMPRQKDTITNVEVHGYTDSDFSGDQDEKKSTTCYIFKNGGVPITRAQEKKLWLCHLVKMNIYLLDDKHKSRGGRGE